MFLHQKLSKSYCVINSFEQNFAGAKRKVVSVEDIAPAMTVRTELIECGRRYIQAESGISWVEKLRAGDVPLGESRRAVSVRPSPCSGIDDFCRIW